jgi:hypothetical protein
MKLYTVKSSAHRAAKQAGLEKEQYEIVEVDGRFGFQPIEVAEEPVQEAPAEVEAIEAPAKGEAKPEVKHKSDIERPTKTVWHIADEMSAANPQVRRKDVIAECVRRGIAFYTARTQYQQWLATKKGSTK